jgi:serine/threonine protein kinase
VTSGGPLPAARLGKYEIVRVIGSGGGGVVYEAIHLELKKRVAVKILHPKLARHPEALRRFVREGEAASRIRHPHVVDIADVGVHEGQPFLVMELLEGRDLRAYLDERGALPLQEALDLMMPVIAAVAAGHDAGVVHRDLKPHNVFIASGRGGDPLPKVLDFGVSKLLDPSPANVSWSGAENRMGTLCYMSPEQVRGSRHLDARVDQYALGLILYECLTGARVHAGEDQVAIIRKISEGTVLPPTQLRPDLPPELEAALLQALAASPDDRFPTVHHFGRALLPFAGPRARAIWQNPVQPPPPPRPRLSPTVLLNTPALHLEHRPRTATMPDPSRPRRRRMLPLLVITAGSALGALLAYNLRPSPSPSPSPYASPSPSPSPTEHTRASTKTIDETPPAPPLAPEEIPPAADPGTGTLTEAAAPIAVGKPAPPPSQRERAPERPRSPAKPVPAEPQRPPSPEPARTRDYHLGTNQSPIIPD